MLIHGRISFTARRGLVADECPACADVRPFFVTDHYTIGFLFLIPTDLGKLEYTVRKCQVCKGKYACDKKQYERILPAGKAEGLSPEELLERTNPRLAVARQSRQELQAAVAREVGSGTIAEGVEALRRLALANLRELAAEVPGAAAYEERLQGWDDLTQEGREDLLREIDRFVTDHKNLKRAAMSVSVASQSFPNEAGVLPVLFLGVPLTLLLLNGALRLFHEPLVTLTFTLAGIVMSFFIYRFFARSAYRRWFHNKFIPRMEKQQIEMSVVLTAIEGWKKSRGELDGKLKALLNNSDLLVRILRERDERTE